jgi:hypothetical protein
MFADASAASNVIQSYVTPVMAIMITLASLAVAFFLINSGIHYMSSAGNPEKLDHAKRVIKNALIGLVIVIAAATLTAILSHALGGSGPSASEKLPSMTTIQPAPTQNGLTDALINGITGLLKNIVESGAKPFLDALTYFTHSTPLMSANSGVFNLWLAVVAIADGLFVLVVALLGFHVMSFSSLGLEEIEIKHMLPKLALVFLLVNTSIFAIDAIIGLSNMMITAINAAYPSKSVWDSLNGVVNQQSSFGLVLFINVVILELAASIFSGMSAASPDHSLNPLMAMIVGIATLLALLKTQSVLLQLSYASNGARTMTELGGQLTNVILASGKRAWSMRDRNGDDGTSGGGGKSNRGGGADYRQKTRKAPPAGGPTPTYAEPIGYYGGEYGNNGVMTRVAPKVEKESDK